MQITETEDLIFGSGHWRTSIQVGYLPAIHLRRKEPSLAANNSATDTKEQISGKWSIPALLLYIIEYTPIMEDPKHSANQRRSQTSFTSKFLEAHSYCLLTSPLAWEVVKTSITHLWAFLGWYWVSPELGEDIGKNNKCLPKKLWASLFLNYIWDLDIFPRRKVKETLFGFWDLDLRQCRKFKEAILPLSKGVSWLK